MRYSILFLACLVFLASCQKELTEPKVAINELNGNYRFLGVDMKTETSAQAINDPNNQVWVTRVDYISKNNEGTITITGGNTLISSNIAYSIDTVMYLDEYVNGQLVYTMDIPFLVDLPPITTTSTFQHFPPDSMYSPSGSFVNGGAVQATVPAGYKYEFIGNQLIMRVNYYDVKTENENGVMTRRTMRMRGHFLMERM